MNCKTSNFPSSDDHHDILKERVEREREREMQKEIVSRKPEA